MSDLVPRGRREMTTRPAQTIGVRRVGPNMHRVTRGDSAQVSAYVDGLLASGVRVRLHESRAGNGTVTRHIELLPPAERGPAPWWLIGGGILLGLAILGTVAIMGTAAVTHLVAEHPGWSLVAAVLIAMFAGGGIKVFINLGRR